MPVKLINISSIAPNSTGQIEMPGDLNLIGTPAPVYRINGVPISTGGGAITSVFGRTGVVVATNGDYTAAQVTNAVSTLGSYSDPSWMTSLGWSKITGAPAFVTAAGSSGQVQFNAGGTPAVLGASANLYWDNTNSRLGIGTSAPLQIVDIVSSPPYVALRGYVNSANGPYFWLEKGRGTPTARTPVAVGDNLGAIATGGLVSNGSRPQATIIDTIVETVSASSLSCTLNFYTNDGTYIEEDARGLPKRMTITGAGNVGIGVTAPTARLSVDTLITVNRWSSDNAPASYFAWKARGTQGSGTQVQTGDGMLYIGWAGQVTGMNANHGCIRSVVGTNLRSCDLIFLLNDGTDNAAGGHGAERMRIYSNGNVSIGVTTPTARLSVDSTMQISRWSSDNLGPQIYFWKTRGTQASPTAVQTADAMLYFGWGGLNTGFNANHGAIRAVVGTNLRSSDLQFLLNDGTDNALNGNGTERLRISSNGDVTTTLNRIVLGGTGYLTVGTSGFAGQTGDIGVSRDSSPGTGVIFFGNSGSNYISYDGSRFQFSNQVWVTAGNVGIGTAAAYKLHIMGVGQDGASGLYWPLSGADGCAYLQDSGGGAGNGGALMFGANQGPFATIKGYITSGAGPLGNIGFYLRLATTDSAFYERLRLTNTGRLLVTEVGSITGQAINFYAANGGLALQIDPNGPIRTADGAVHPMSDARIKENVQPFTQGLEMLRRLQPKSFVFTGDAGTVKGMPGVGLVAQDLQQMAPELVESFPGEISGEKTDVLSYKPAPITWAMVNAIKELSERLERLEGKLSA